MPSAVRFDGADRNGGRGRACRGPNAASYGTKHGHLVDRAPGAAFQATPYPFGGGMAAFRTAILRTCLGHPMTVSGWCDRSAEVRPAPAIRGPARFPAPKSALPR